MVQIKFDELDFNAAVLEKLDEGRRNGDNNLALYRLWRDVSGMLGVPLAADIFSDELRIMATAGRVAITNGDDTHPNRAFNSCAHIAMTEVGERCYAGLRRAGYGARPVTLSAAL